MATIDEIIADLVSEYDRLDAILAGLTREQWLHPSACAGWSIADVVLHLAQSEEFVTISVADAVTRAAAPAERSGTVDGDMEALVRAERSDPSQAYARWRAARHASVAALRAADPHTAVSWAATPLRPGTLATTRLAEHWAHGLDITGPLGIPFPDTARLRHIAWLGHRTLPYGFALQGEAAQDVYCDLTAPDGEHWQFGPIGAPSTVSGSAGAFCRVGAQRLPPEESGLVTNGPHAQDALRVLRNYAY